MRKQKTIEFVVNNKLCNTCGACYSVCPKRAISYRETIGGYYFPEINQELCNNCGLCYNICPGIHFNQTLKNRMPDDPFVGIGLETYVGKALNKELFSNSQSGGIVSAILSNSLENGIIKGAVTVRMDYGNPPRAVIRIAQSQAEIYQAQKSKYCPVPLLTFIEKLSPENIPIAVVGIPCQIHGLINMMDKVPSLKKKIAFTAGLVCERIMTYRAIDYLISKSAFDKEDKLSIHYKNKNFSGYPGNVHLFSQKEKSYIIPAATRMKIKDYFTPARCRICFDKMNVFSDITVGDPHGLEGIDRRNGESMFIVRTERGREIVNSVQDDKAMNIRPIDYEEVIVGQAIANKRQQWRGYIEAWKELGNDVPDYYERVKKQAIQLTENEKYKKDLKYSLSLDCFSSSEKLLCFVEKSIIKKERVRKLLSPVRYLKRIMVKSVATIIQ